MRPEVGVSFDSSALPLSHMAAMTIMDKMCKHVSLWAHVTIRSQYPQIPESQGLSCSRNRRFPDRQNPGSSRGRGIGSMTDGCIDDVMGASQQDADTAYTAKGVLQAKVQSLDKDIPFLKSSPPDVVRTLHQTKVGADGGGRASFLLGKHRNAERGLAAACFILPKGVLSHETRVDQQIQERGG